MPIVFQDKRSKVKVVLSLSRKHGRIHSRIQTEPLAPGSYSLVQLITMLRGRCLLFFKIGGQRSRLDCQIVGKHGKIKCRQDTD